MSVLIKTAVEYMDRISYKESYYCPDVRCHDDQNDDVGFFEGAAHPNEELIRVVEECRRNLYNSIK